MQNVATKMNLWVMKWAVIILNQTGPTTKYIEGEYVLQRKKNLCVLSVLSVFLNNVIELLNYNHVA